MKTQTLGSMIASLRKEKGITQLALAEKMGVTDKAVSKWERDLSYPDLDSIPKLAEIFNVTVDELLRAQRTPNETRPNSKIAAIVPLALKGVALAMGVAVAVLSVMADVDAKTAISMLGIGLACLAAAQFSAKE